MALAETSIRDVHRQERTALPDIRRQPCGGHVPVDAKEPGGDGYVRQNDDEGFQELYDRMLAYSSTKQSIQRSESEKTTRKNDPMDVDALSKGSGKGKSIEKGKKGRGQNHTSNVRCWNCGKTGHYGRDCSEMRWSKAKTKPRRKVTNMLMDGLGVASMLTHGGRRQIGREELVQDGGRQQTTGHHGNQKNQWVKLRSTALKDAAARALEGAQNKE